MLTSKLWLACEAAVSLLTTSQGATTLLKLIHTDRWERRSSMVLGSVVVNLMDWNGGVGDVWLDCLTLNDWLYVLVHVL